MPKFKVEVIITEKAFRYVEATDAAQALAIVGGEDTDAPDLCDAEYDYEDISTNEETTGRVYPAESAEV